MIAWMLYTALTGVLVMVAARAAESIARLVRLPTRWPWMAAIVLTAGFAAAAPLRRAAPAVVSSTGASVDFASLPIGESIDLVRQQLPASITLVIALAWGGASVFLVAVMIGVHLRLRRARRRWPVAEVQGTRVRVSPETGPVVVGFGKPEIVVPAWLLHRTVAEQRLIVAHEREHVDAHDTLLLAAGCAAVAVMPWNPAAWYALSRLRLAVELDCDARVLRRGVEAGMYGALLIDVAALGPRLRFGAALANSRSHLHQRILAMRSRAPRFARLRGTLALTVAMASLVVACEAKMPTAAEIDRMDVASAEMRARAVGSIARGDTVVYIVAGNRVSKEQAYQLRPDEIGEIEVRGAKEAGANIIEVRRVDVVRRAPGEEGEIRISSKLAGPNAPIFLIDGKRSTEADLKAIKRENIERVEVIKGASAAAQYGADAANGVIVVHTKGGR